MKILFLSDSLKGGGKERRMIELIKGLDKSKDYEISLLALDDDVFYKDIFETNCELKTLKRSKGYELKIQKLVLGYIKEIKPDVIHFWGELCMIYLTPLFITNRKIVFFSSIIADTSPKKGFVRNMIRRYSFKKSTLILSNTFAGLRAYGASENKSKVIYNGFDFNRISDLKDKVNIRTKYQIKSDFVLMMVGVYNDRKDYPTFLKATELLLQKGYKISVITAGDGDYSEYKNMIRSENLDFYHFLNFQNDIESIMNIASIGVLCSNSTKHGEGISNALLEFMALGKPVIGTNDGGNVELIEDGISGYLTNINDHVDLCSKLMSILDNEKLNKDMGDRSLEIVKNKFSYSNMIAQFLSEYDKINRNLIK
ncbi:glycosyl transferase [Neptunitalea chrysea]|uniref:Glycosyl transferase n=1 Tax=Neptunitalea chrysea TaxID=1647581 RepID=A0A9W6B4N3_9FLAO|nr:glycosyltransferase family 4 protein [Neptunitalea chrysea]GLB51555.1 glycosyl transferase [Neptunitalea chrysea]